MGSGEGCVGEVCEPEVVVDEDEDFGGDISSCNPINREY